MITYPVPSPEILALALGGRAEAIMAYRKTAEVTLADGTEVRPTLRTAKDIVTGGLSGLLIPVAVAEGSYTVIDRDRDELIARAEKLKWERYAFFMADDGIKDNPRREHGTCDDCGKAAYGMAHRAPDAMGYPTVVLFDADCGWCAS